MTIFKRYKIAQCSSWDQPVEGPIPGQLRVHGREGAVRLILGRQERRFHRPGDRERRAAPDDAAFAMRRIPLRAYIEERRLCAGHAESVRTTQRNVQLSIIVRGEFESMPPPKHSTAFA